MTANNPYAFAMRKGARSRFGSDHGAEPVWSTNATTVVYRSRSEEHTSELQSQFHLVCRLLLEKKKKKNTTTTNTTPHIVSFHPPYLPRHRLTPTHSRAHMLLD